MRIHINITVNRAVQILLIYLFFVVVSGGLFAPIFAVFITGFIPGATLKTVGFALALYAVAKSVLQIPLARFLDKHRGERDDFYTLMAGALVAVGRRASGYLRGRPGPRFWSGTGSGSAFSIPRCASRKAARSAKSTIGFRPIFTTRIGTMPIEC